MTCEDLRRRRVSRRDALRLGAALAGSAALAACGGGAATPAAPGVGDRGGASAAPATTATRAATATGGPVAVPNFTSGVAAKPVKLELWTFVDTHARWFQQMADAYRAQVNPGFELNVVQTATPEHHNKLLVSFQAGGVGAPDLADINQGFFGSFVKGDIDFVDLSGRLRDGGYLDQLVDARMALYAYGGKFYGVEHALTPVVLYYRDDLYAASGARTPFATWDDFIAATKPLVKGDVKGVPIGWGFYDLVLRQRGFDTFDRDGNCVADSPQAIETLEWMLGLRDTHRIAAEPPAGAQASGTAADQALYGAFRQGQFLAIPQADWYAGFLKDNLPDLAGKWRALPLPAYAAGGKRTSVNGGTGLAVVRFSKNQDAAWDFTRYAMLSKEGNVQQYLAIKLWPAFKPAWDDPRMYAPDAYFGGQELGRLYSEVGAEAPPQYQSPFRSDFNRIRQDRYTRDIFDGKLAPAEGLKRLADEIRRLR